MTSPALICPTCRAAFDLEAAAESLAQIRDCCFDAIKAAQELCIVANATQAFARESDRIRPFAAKLSDEAVTSANPRLRAAASAYRNARGRNREAERWVHARDTATAWYCGTPKDHEQAYGQDPTCPYCLGLMLRRGVRP